MKRFKHILGTGAFSFASFFGHPALQGSKLGGVSMTTFWFYVGTPLLIGTFLGLVQVGRTYNWPMEFSIVYWVTMSLFGTLANDLVTTPIARILRPRRVPLAMVLIIGQLTASIVLTGHVARGYHQWWNEVLSAELFVRPGFGSSSDILTSIASNVLIWLTINAVFFYGFRMPRFGYEPPNGFISVPRETDLNWQPHQNQQVPTTAIAPANVYNDNSTDQSADKSRGSNSIRPNASFMSRVRPDRRGTLLALHAEGHYLNVYTNVGNDLITYSFSEAIAELDEKVGARTHRSWWVAESAIVPSNSCDRLVLSNGLEVPVSRSYLLAIRNLGWLR